MGIILFRIIIKGNLVLQRILYVYSIFDMNVIGFVFLVVLIMYITIVVKEDVSVLVIMVFDVDYVNIFI